MESIVAAHNNKIIHEDPNPEESKCNCRNKMECPMPGKCTSKNIVYEAIVTSLTAIKKYIGITSSKFKVRYALHKSSFNHPEKRNQT